MVGTFLIDQGQIMTTMGFSGIPRIPNTNQNANNTRTDQDILFIGSGNFSLPLSFARNHIQNPTTQDSQFTYWGSNFGKRMIVTEFKSQAACMNDTETRNNISELRRLGATVLFGVDGTQIDKTFRNFNFSRIQWDCPDINGVFCDFRNELPDTIFSVAQAASRLQKTGSTLHFTLFCLLSNKLQIMTEVSTSNVNYATYQ